MRTYKLDKGVFEPVGKANNKAVLVSAYVEDGSVVSDEVHIICKRSLQICGSTPVALGNDLMPGAKGCLGLGVCSQKSWSVFLAITFLAIACSQYGINLFPKVGTEYTYWPLCLRFNFE